MEEHQHPKSRHEHYPAFGEMEDALGQFGVDLADNSGNADARRIGDNRDRNRPGS
jgi:hypothetical protein